MPTLHLRNLPDDVYQVLAVRAERAQRSVAQQALIELRAATGMQTNSKRREVLERIRRSVEHHTFVAQPLPEASIREDRTG